MNDRSSDAAVKTGAIQDGDSAEKSANPHLKEHALTPEQFRSAVSAANQQFNLIRKKYPDLKAYLVVGLSGEQAKLDEPPLNMFKDFQGVVFNDAAKSEMIKFLKMPVNKEATKEEIKKREMRFLELAEQVKYNGNCRVEIRFHQLDYECVWKLQVDELVNRAMTPQTRASIRIVLGTVSDFAKCT